MPHVYLPADHSDADLALASRVAEAVDSEELFVAWTSDAGNVRAPEARAEIRPAPMNPFAQALAEVIVSFHALFALLLHPGRRQEEPVQEPFPRPARGPLEGADL